MRFYIPEWDDLVDLEYDFINESHSKSHNSTKRNDMYMWEIFNNSSIPFDGVLVSLMTIINNGSKFEDIKNSGGLHQYLRLPKRYSILADCGAWGYINKEEEGPRFEATEVFNYYKELGIQEAVTVDHLVLPRVKVQGRMIDVDVQRRMDITYNNGIEGYYFWKKNYSNDFNLLVSVQGLRPSDYLNMFNNYLEHEISSFAFGGLAKKPTKIIIEIIKSLISFLEKKEVEIERIHFFGLGRRSLFSLFQEVEKHGVKVSFDTSSWLRQAWLGGKYFLVESDKLQKYTALRVPFTRSDRSSFKGKRKLTESADIDKLEKLESKTMKFIRAYNENQKLLNEALDAIGEYDKRVLHELKKSYRDNYEQKAEERIIRLENHYEGLEKKYLETLKNRPWNNCDCPICQKHGIDVVIFRGNDRNRRRGFHNTYIMYHKVMKNPNTWGRIKERRIEHRFIDSVDELANLEGNVLIITGCTKSKMTYKETIMVKANELYTGRLFKAVRLFSKIKGFSYIIISAKYGLVYPNDIIGGYEKMLSSEKDINNIKNDVHEKLSKILPKYDTIIVIAGKRYRDVLEDIWDERFVYVKTKGYALLTRMIQEAIKKVSVSSLKFYI